MNVRLVNKGITEVEADVIIVNLFSGVKAPGGATGIVDKALSGAIQNAINQAGFAGKLGDVLTLYPGAKRPFGRVLVVGLGDASKFSTECARQAAGSAARAAMKGECNTVASVVHGAGLGGLDAGPAAQATVEGTIMGTYLYEEFKSNRTKNTIEQFLVVELDEAKCRQMDQWVRKGNVIGNSVNIARDLVNAPGNAMPPAAMAQKASELARQSGLSVEVLEKTDMERLGMGALLGVAQGSVQPPKLIVLRQMKGGATPVCAIVGKGITFDSGGISLKNRDGMEAMKDDMGGAAAVIAAMTAVAALDIPVNLIGLAVCTENLPSGTALKPGDVIKAMTGKTIEIISTDAEGRLILADGVAYAAALGARTIVDVATLTGAVGQAMGSGFYSGIVSTCPELIAQVKQAAGRAGEKFWEFPADDDYKELYRSEVADIKNSGGPGGGGVTVGGLIIGEFAGDTCWAHLDIANNVFTTREKGYQPKGATGHPVRTLVALAEDWAARK